jgi:diacylglycerol O-acyltransferase / wax synthase
MEKPVPRCCLSGVDAAFLYLERKELPLHIAGLLTFEAPLPFDQFVASVDSRLHLIPRYLQIAVPAPFNLGHPVWEFAPHFDIRNHVFHARLEAPGGESELEDFASRILSEPMDRGKPLWDIHIVDGLADGRGALLLRIHHSLADGISGIALVKAMLDPTPECAHPIRKPRRRPPAATAEYSLQDALRNAVRGILENLMASETVLLALADTLSTPRTNDTLDRLLGLLPELAAPVERLPFNKPAQAGRKFRWAEVDFGAVQAIRAALGGTINDVILTIYTRAIARYARLHRETIVKRFMRVVIPVSIRKGDAGESLGNRITFLPVVLPLDVADAGEHLKAVSARTEIMTNARAADLVGLLASWIGASPPPLQKLFWTGIPLITLPVPLFNTICTNVAGSPVPLYACGKRLLASYPHVPTGYDLGVNCAVQSYDGRLFFGLTADAHACPDVDRLRNFLLVSFGELCRSAGLKKPRRRPARHTAEAAPEPPIAAPQTLAAKEAAAVGAPAA